MNRSFRTPLHAGILALLSLLAVTSSVSAQHLNNPFKSMHDSRELIIGIDNRYTHINDKFAVIYGLYTGIGYGDNLRMKFSISGTPFEAGRHSKDVSVNEVGHLLFASVGQEFDFFTFGRFKTTAYLNGGFGYHFFRLLDPEKTEIDKGKEAIVPVETGIHLRYQITEIVAFKTGGGWRFVLPEHTDDLGGYYIKFTAVVNPKKLGAWMRHRKAHRSGR